jgi:hypothetical protein
MTPDPRPLSAEEIDELRTDLIVSRGTVKGWQTNGARRLLATLDAERARHAALVEAARNLLDGMDQTLLIHDVAYEYIHDDIAALRAAIDGEPT